MKQEENELLCTQKQKKSWKHHQETGLRTSWDETKGWLNTCGADDEPFSMPFQYLSYQRRAR